MLTSTARLINLYNLHKTAGCKEPLGAFFCNRYIEHYTDELRRIFHEIDDTVCIGLIDAWLGNNNHPEFLPALLNRSKGD